LKATRFTMRHRFTIHQLISRLVITLGFLLAGFGQGTVLAEDFPDDVPSEPWHISADQIDYDQVKDEYLARGNVSIIRPGRSLTADMVRLNQGSKQAVAEGNVRLVYGDNILSGRQLELDLESETGTLVDGTVFISPITSTCPASVSAKPGPRPLPWKTPTSPPAMALIQIGN
jgi:lipopolysaccharide assembly outer membrane protein LptD (OstA)